MTLAFFVVAGAAQSVGAAIYVVNQTGDVSDGVCDANCTLRDAINTANRSNTLDFIDFASPLFDTPQTINLTSAQLTIINPLIITGRGARLLTVRRSSAGGTPRFHIFGVSGAVTVGISGITISNGDGGSGFGGGITNNGGTLLLNNVAVSGNTQGFLGGGIRQDGGTTTISNSTISGNTAGSGGGGIFVNSGGTVNIANSTVSGNSASSNSGGGIYSGGTLNMNNVTVSDNFAAYSGGGVSNLGGTVNTRNSIIAGNFATGGNSPDVEGGFTSNGSNLIGRLTGSTGFTQPTDKTNVAANLAPLANNGGQTDTHALYAGSPAIDAGDNCVVNQSCGTNNPSAALTNDQRGEGFPRQVGAAVNIGAVEVQLAPTAAAVSVSGRVTTESGRGIRSVIVTMTDMHGNVRTATSTSFGYYRFENVAAGETYIFAARGKRFFFEQNAQVHSIMEETSDINFVAGERTVFSAN